MTGSAKKVAKYTRGTSFSSIVEVRKADRTLKQLEADQIAAGVAVEARDLLYESGVNVFENQAELYVPDKTALQLGSQLRATGAVGTEVPGSVKVIQTSLSQYAVDAYAGHTLNTSNGNFCTAGYAVRSPGGVVGITTAGHCPETMTFGSTKATMYWLSPQYNSGSLDFQVHYGSRITAKPWARDNETDSGTPGYRYIYALANRPDIPLNSWVCKYGANTRFTCGYVKDKNYQSGGVYTSRTWIRVSNDRRIGWGGDSGGPVYDGHKALGLVHSYFKNTTSTFYGDYTFMGMNYITDQGFRILFATP